MRPRRGLHAVRRGVLPWQAGRCEVRHLAAPPELCDGPVTWGACRLSPETPSPALTLRSHQTPTVILVHGFWHGSWCWSLVAEQLAARGIASVAVDLDGHGLKGRVARVALASAVRSGRFRR
ncbi:alpha/beta fold hydrolase [Streptomyces sp. NPDC054794]